eukprot:1233266-Karenia_brevis.AAC.1
MGFAPCRQPTLVGYVSRTVCPGKGFWIQICYLGSKLDIFGVQTGWFCDHLGSKLGSLGFKLRGLEAILGQVGLTEARMAKVSSKLGSSWTKLGSSWDQVEPSCSQVGPSWD